MRQKRTLFYLLLFIIVSVVLLVRLQMHTLILEWRWESLPVHSAVESVGTISAILMAMVLLQKRREENGWQFFLLAMGFVGMGLLDGFHGLTTSGHGFVLLHSMASLVGGFLFALVWLPEPRGYELYKRWLAWIVAICSIFFGVYTLLLRETLPLMVQNGQFTVDAVIINFSAGILFVVGAIRLLYDFHRSGNLEIFLFCCLALFFGIAELMFKYSAVWQDNWWFWHMLRLVAYLLALGFVIHRHQQATDEIRKLNVELEQRVIARTAELEAFSYSVSHDLRAPLRAIDGFSRVVMEDYLDKLDNEGKRLLNIIRKNTQNMGQLIDDLLSFSRIGRKEVTKEDIDMVGLARMVFDELNTQSGRHITLKLDGLPPAYGDRALMRQVFVNLLSNAVKFTRIRENAIIEIACKVENNQNVYYIRDNGVGFDMRYINKLFGVFQRLHSAEEFEGTGVGLAIVHRVINRHNGRVWAEGKVNEGATFYFSIPLGGK